MTRLIDADAFKKQLEESYEYTELSEVIEMLDNASTVERPQGECKSCKYYHPYYIGYSDKPRGDGYCVIARMTPEGMTTINCNDEFGCSDYQKGGAE